MNTTKTTVILRAGDGKETLAVFDDATGQLVDGCLVIKSQKVTALYAPGQWLRAWTENVDG